MLRGLRWPAPMTMFRHDEGHMTAMFRYGEEDRMTAIGAGFVAVLESDQCGRIITRTARTRADDPAASRTEVATFPVRSS